MTARKSNGGEHLSIISEHISRPRIILGSGRSGTTWVLDCLAEANKLRPVFEPLHQNESEVGRLYAYDVLTALDSPNELEQYFTDIEAGQIHSRWIDFRAPRGLVRPKPQYFKNLDSIMRWLSGWRKYLRRRKFLKESVARNELLIKCIRGNLMAEWFAKRLDYRTAFIVRHPCSVVESQLRLGKAWDPTYVRNLYRENDRLHKLTDGRYVKLLNEEHTVLEALTLNWVIENQWPVEECPQPDYKVFYYEDLLERGESSWRELCDSLGLPNAPAGELLQRPSQQSDPKLAGKDVEFCIPGWRNRMSTAQLKSIQRILDFTMCTIYNVGSGRPNVCDR